MKITKDSVGNVILNNGAHRVVLSAALVQAIGEQVYVDSPRGECEGRMVVVALPPVRVAIRPGKEPTVANEDLNWRCWRYTTPDGQLLEHEAFIRSDWKGETWSGIVGLQSFPDEYSPPGSATRKHIQERIEAVLAAEGYEIVDAGDAQAIAHPASSLPVCPSCLVPGEPGGATLCPECDVALTSVDDRGGFFCSKCGNSWIVEDPRELRRGPTSISEHFQALHEKLGGQLDGVDLAAEVMEGREDDPEEEDDGDDEEEYDEDGRVHRRWLAERFMDEMQDAGDGDHTTGYGAFPGGDPRLFEPDPECSTPEEREAHRVACQEADAMEARGEVPDEVPAHQWVVGKDAVIHVAAPGFGLGVYQIEAPSAAGRLKKPHERNSDFGDVLTVTLEGRNER